MSDPGNSALGGDAGEQRPRVVITNPFVWPHVRRGSERLLNDLANYLRGRGYPVQVCAMAPAGGNEQRNGVAYRLAAERCRTPWRQFNSCHYFALTLGRTLATMAMDVVFCLNYFDAYAALRARRRTGGSFRVVFLAVGIPTRRYFRAVPLDAWFMATVLREADEVLVLSRFAQDRLRDDFGRESRVLPPPVAVADFAPASHRQGPPAPGTEPRILFVGDLSEPRKGARVLCEAFVGIKARHPGASLVFSGRAPQPLQAALTAGAGFDPVRQDIHFLGVGKLGDLPRLYAAAAVTVLPAVWEAFGLVLVESLAAGTPVVGARHGGIPDIVTDPQAGCLFEVGEFTDQTRNVEGLTEAILEVLSRPKTPQVARACMELASRFSWDALGPRYERTLRPGEGR